MYNTVIRHLYILWCSCHTKPSIHLSQCKVITLLLTVIPLHFPTRPSTSFPSSHHQFVPCFYESVFVLFVHLFWFYLSQEVQEPQGHIIGLQMVFEVLIFSAQFSITKEKWKRLSWFPESWHRTQRYASLPLATRFLPTPHAQCVLCTLTFLLLVCSFPVKYDFSFSFPYHF